MRRGCWRGNVILVFKYMKDCYCFRDTDSSGPSLPDHFPGPLIHSSLLAQMVKNLPAMQETQVWSLGWEDPLEKGMVTHFSILAWRIPRAEEPGELQSMGSQTVGGNRVPFTSLIHSCWSSIPSGVGGDQPRMDPSVLTPNHRVSQAPLSVPKHPRFTQICTHWPQCSLPPSLLLFPGLLGTHILHAAPPDLGLTLSAARLPTVFLFWAPTMCQALC